MTISEVNFEIALSLLEKASQLGHVEAFEQLIIMYQEGKGVARMLQIKASILMNMKDANGAFHALKKLRNCSKMS